MVHAKIVEGGPPAPPAVTRSNTQHGRQRVSPPPVGFGVTEHQPIPNLVRSKSECLPAVYAREFQFLGWLWNPTRNGVTTPRARHIGHAPTLAHRIMLPDNRPSCVSSHPHW